MELEETLKGVCIEDTYIEHRVFNNTNTFDPQYKYFCYDSRECVYKKVTDNKNYCTLHLLQAKENAI